MKEILKALDLEGELSGTFSGKWASRVGSEILTSFSPIDGSELGKIQITGDREYEAVLADATKTFLAWREMPAPKRGEIIRDIGEEIRRYKTPLGKLITLEMGKILAEGEGEVQEAIDIADFAVGLSRQIAGLTMHSERPQHRMYEQWHPLGNVAVITAFNFPLAVWAWNALIAAVCGDTVVWKPSEVTPLVSIAMTKICERVCAKHGFPGVFSLITGGGELGQKMAEDRRFPLVSVTGSCGVGKKVAQIVAGRLGRTLLELGGNNAVTVLKDANLDLAVRAVLFGAVGTAGQRCTSTRRVLIEEPLVPEFTRRLLAAYKTIPIGNPLESKTLLGPLIHERAVVGYKNALERIKKEGGEVLYGGEVLEGFPSKLYVAPTIVKANRKMPVIFEETFAPIVYLIPVASFEEALEANNEVPQGLSSAIFTDRLQFAEKFLSAAGSDCGIANVNLGTSGAEIGGAFGGEKDTGGGRESGSDSWKAYMRRQTNTINWGGKLPLAQGITFGE